MSDVPLVIDLCDVGRHDLPRVGGKAANLGEMIGAGLPVPPGFCVTTAAFDRFVAGACARDPALARDLARLDALAPGDLDGARVLGERLRSALTSIDVPEDIRSALVDALARHGVERPYAVRSSATAEDQPDASFAGQQDTYLNVRGEAALVDRVRACWASLYTDRAILYRRKAGYESASARLAVVVQAQRAPDVAGILFTADPITGDRRVCSIDASYGLGEALVSGLVNADLYRVRKDTGALIEARLGDKARAIWARPEGGTEIKDVSQDMRERRALDDAALAQLRALAERVEAHQGCPQDIEWCLEGGVLYLLQTRPITSLYPIPGPRPDDGVTRVYASFGHIQVMTAPIRPFARSVFSTIIPIGKPSIDAPSQLLKEAGGRIYMDATPALLRFPLSRVLPVFLTNMDPAIGLRLAVVRDRPEFQAGRRRGAAASKTAIFGLFRVIMVGALRRLFTHDVARARADFNGAVDDLYRRYADALASVEPGAARLRIGQHEIARIFIEALMPIFPPIVAAGLISWKLVGRLVRGRVDPDRVQDLTRGFEGNATTEMDLELGDLADLARMVPALARSLEADEPRVAIAHARQNPDAARFIAAWDAFLSRYGHRCPGEIDVTTPRWHEDPSSLVKSLVGMLHDDRPGEHRRRQEAARKAADEAAALIVEEAGRGLLGVVRRPLARALIRRVRTYLALREHGKYLMTRLFYLLREAALEAGDIAARRGLLRAPEDVWMLELDELIALLEGAGPRDASALVDARRQLLARQASLTPPPVITSDGEVPPLPHPDEPLPDGVLGGLGASAGTVEGVARVVLDPNREVLRAGEILVAPFTDPGWTPLFIHAAGLVMEVGGLMTHGSVVAREYGIPAVVGVTGATAAIATGQRIRVDGSRGRVTILSEETDKEEAA